MIPLPEAVRPFLEEAIRLRDNGSIDAAAASSGNLIGIFTVDQWRALAALGEAE